MKYAEKMTLSEIAEEMALEAERAIGIHDSFNSAHEGYSVILEELEELWDIIKKKREARDNEQMMEEAKQIGAMAIRFIHDLAGADSK